jgi:hypothetical protein
VKRFRGACIRHDPAQPDLLVDLPEAGPGHASRRRQHDGPGPGARLDQPGERVQAQGRHLVGHVGDRHAEAQVGLVGAVAQQRLGIAEAREGARGVHVHQLAQAHEERLDQLDDALHAGERHLDVHLRELRLAVRAQVLVAEAAHDLEVAVHARDHQDLLEDLRRLRERVEVGVVDAGRHQVIPRPLGRGLGQERRLDLEEALLVEVAADLQGGPVPEPDVALHPRPAQVQVPVLEADVLARPDLVLDGKRRRPGLGKHADLAGQHLHASRGDVGVDGLGRSRRHLPHHGQHVFAARAIRRGVGRGGHLGLGDDLADPLAVAQVDEDHAPQVAACVRPPHEGHGLAHVGLAERAAVVGAREVLQRLSHSASP